MAATISNKSRFKRQKRGSVVLNKKNRRLFILIYQWGLATKEQLTLAIRGERKRNDRYIARALRKLFDHAYIGKLPVPINEPDIYCVSQNCYRGRKAAIEIFGSDEKATRRLANRARGQVAHALMLTWLTVYLSVGAKACGYPLESFHHRDLSSCKKDLGFVPDRLIVLTHPEGRIIFCLEYQRRQAAETKTHQKIENYIESIQTLKVKFEAKQAWVLFVFEKDERWVEGLKRELEGIPGGEIFFLTTRERFLSAEPRKIWLLPIWFWPGERNPVSIFVTD